MFFEEINCYNSACALYGSKQEFRSLLSLFDAAENGRITLTNNERKLCKDLQKILIEGLN